MSRQFGKHFALVMVLGVVAVLADTAWAQRGGGGGRGIGRLFGGVPKAQLASLEQVQTELKMTDEQKSKTAGINDELRNKRRDLFGSGFGRFSEIRGDMEKLNREASEKVDGVLDDAQKKRLQEIVVQVNGPQALGEPAVVAQLKLNDEQKTSLEEALAENAKAAEEALAEFGQASQEDRREKSRALREKAAERLLSVLSDQQKTEFDQMKGTPIEIDMSSLYQRNRGSN